MPFVSHMMFLYTLEQDLLTFRLPQDRLPGSDLISKAILKENNVVDLITRAILDVPNGTYTAVAPTEWSDGTRSDVVYIPRLSISKSLPPFLIEVQRTVRESFMQRVIHYCIHINRAFDRKPIVLIFATDSICPNSLLEQFKPSSPDKPWLNTCSAHYFWAKDCFVIAKHTLNSFDETSMEPLLALAQFFIEQQPTLFEHTCAANATIQMLYGLAKDHILQGKEYQHNFVDAMDVICDTHIRKLEQARALVNDPKKCVKIIDRLVDYDKKLKRRYSEMDECSSSQEQLDEPTYAPLTSSASSSSKEITSHQEERAFVISFKEKLNGGRISWSRCLAAGRKKGLFARYSTVESLRVNYRKYIAP